MLPVRIAKILLETDAQPEKILCLTYDDASAAAMRKKLMDFIGPDAYRLTICTFQTFCKKVIQDNPNLFPTKGLHPISDLERIQLFKELIDGFPKNHPLKRYRGDVYFEIRTLLPLFSIMKKEGWVPSFLNEKIDELLAAEQDDLRKEQLEKLYAAVNEFERFQLMMQHKNRYDLDDAIHWVLKFFEESPAHLSNYQQQFLYILVDEFQNLSGAQYRLIQQLISGVDKPNILVAGNDDEGSSRVYRNQAENMRAFAENHQRDLQTIILKNNYRSSSPILNVSKTLIGRNTLGMANQLPDSGDGQEVSTIKITQDPGAPVIRAYQSRQQEAIDITLKVQQLLQQGVTPSRIGILYNDDRLGEELSRYFILRNLPIYGKRNFNILDVPLARKVILILRYLAAEHDVPNGGDEMLFEILHFDWFNIPHIEIAKITVEMADQRASNRISLRRILSEKSHQPPKDLFSQGLLPSLKKASAILEQLFAEVPNVPLQDLFEHIIKEVGIRDHIIQSKEKTWHLHVLTCLFNFINEETLRNPSLTLQQLVDELDLMDREKLGLQLLQANGSDEDVHLLTPHGCKGTEFEYLFLSGCNAAYWEHKRGPGEGSSLLDSIFLCTSAGQHEDATRKLFYVAFTRAEQHIFLSYSLFGNDGKALEPTLYLKEIQEQHQLPTEKILVDSETLAEFELQNFVNTDAPAITQIREDFISRQVEKFVMNVSALNNYLRCPLEFYFKYIVRIPSPKNEATEFGSSVHYALEQLFKKMRETERFPGKEVFLSDFSWYMHGHRESFTREQFSRRMEYGGQILFSYYEKYINSWNKIVAVERNIRNVYVNGVPLKGKLDKLEFDGREVNIVDYKTGDPDKAMERLDPPNENTPNGGDYWRQVVFYKILVDNYENKQWKVVSSEIDFIEPDKKGVYRKFKLVVRPEDVATVKHQVTTTWQKIQDHDFYAGCGKESCHWCNFVKNWA